MVMITYSFNGVLHQGQFLAQDGVAAAPGYSFASDPSTGFYLTGTSIGYSQSGSVKWVFQGQTFKAQDNNSPHILAPGGLTGLRFLPRGGNDGDTGVHANDADSFGHTCGGVVAFVHTEAAGLIKGEYTGSTVRNIGALSASTDAFDAEGVTHVAIDNSGGAITLGGLVNGVTGQVIHFFLTSNAQDVIVENAEGANQDIITVTGADITMENYGGFSIIYNGSNWYMYQKSKE